MADKTVDGSSPATEDADAKIKRFVDKRYDANDDGDDDELAGKYANPLSRFAVEECGITHGGLWTVKTALFENNIIPVCLRGIAKDTEIAEEDGTQVAAIRVPFTWATYKVVGHALMCSKKLDETSKSKNTACQEVIGPIMKLRNDLLGSFKSNYVPYYLEQEYDDSGGEIIV